VRDFGPAYDGFGFKPGKAQNEQMLSALHPILVVKADIPDRQLRAINGH
jgi:hypothetical protein